MRRLDRLVGISLAQISGHCSSGALELLAAADHRIADPTLCLQIRADSRASWPGMGMYRVAARAGISRARGLYMFAVELNAGQAFDSGLLDQVVKDASRAREEFVQSLAGIDLKALASRRLLMLEGPGQGYDRLLGLHLAACEAELRCRHRSLATQLAPQPDTLIDATFS